MRGNNGGKCSDIVAMSLYGGTKGACMYVTTPTLKSEMELRKSV